jgi:predicted DNA-binding transcriptional regulator YafY
VLDASARLLRLLALLQARADWTGAELAGRLGVTVRTLRRDVQRLRDLDYPVDSAPGVAGGYRLGSGAVLPPLLLDDDEAIAVVVGLRGTAGHTVAGLSEASVRALAKLDQVLPARLRERTSALQQATVTLTGPLNVVDLALLTTLATACRRHRRLRCGYRDHGGALSTRLIEPYRLVSTSYRWYLMAFDLDRDDWRTFRVDRISDVPADAGRFAPRDHPDAASFVASAVTTAPYRYQARVLVHAPASEVAERFSPTSGIIEEAGQDRCLLTAGADSLNLLTYHLAMLGAEFTVLEPQALIDHVHDAAGRLHRAVSPEGRLPGRGSAWQLPR